MSAYIFPGLWPFIERAARGRDIAHLGRARELWHGKQLQDALGQIPRLDPESRRQLIGHACKIRAALAVALEGMDAAIQEVAREFALFPSGPEAPLASQPSNRDTADART
jgi:hypothetical protein